jgi:hypothetical protein
VDSSATEQLEGLTAAQAARVWAEKSEVILTHEVACFLRRDQASRGPTEVNWHGREREE